MIYLFLNGALLVGLFCLFAVALVFAGGKFDDRYTLGLVLLMGGVLAAQYCLR